MSKFYYVDPNLPENVEKLNKLLNFVMELVGGEERAMTVEGVAEAIAVLEIGAEHIKDVVGVKTRRLPPGKGAQA